MTVFPAPGGRRIMTAYVLIWMAVASLATVYVALLSLRPEFFLASKSSNIEQQLSETKRDMSRAFADLDPLRRTVGEMKLDVATLKYAAKEAVARDNEIIERVSALETSSAKRPEIARIGEATTDSAPAPQAAPPAPAPDPRRAAPAKEAGAAPAKEPPEAGTAPVTAPVVAPLPLGQPKNAKVINGAKKSAAPLETGSIEQKAEQKAKSAATTATKTQVAAKTAAAKPAAVGVLLATGPSIDSLRLNWSILTDRHADAVKNLAPRYIVSGKADQRVYSLIAGPVASAEQAKTLCQSMAQKGLACEVSTYRGNAL